MIYGTLFSSSFLVIFFRDIVIWVDSEEKEKNDEKNLILFINALPFFTSHQTFITKRIENDTQK